MPDMVKRKKYWIEYQRRWREANREKVRKYSLKHRLKHPDVCKKSNRNCKLKKAYGISTAEFEALLAKQNGVCAICGLPPGKTVFNNHHLHVDHDHDTGAVRGLLCMNCNRGLGSFADNPGLLEEAVAYLREVRHSS